MLKPLGFYVLIEMEEVKEVSAGGILLGDVSREQDAADVGYVRDIGSTAFVGYAGCIPSEYPPSDSRYDMQPHEIWGINIGDKVEYRRYEGKVTGQKDYKNFRYIPDSAIIGKVE
jgi:co-chaperonin GroES (HSP10)